MKHSELLSGSRLRRAALSLLIAILLASAGLFLVGQMSRPALSGSGEEPNETLPDLAIWHDGITFSNDQPREGDVITICATVHNIGNASAHEVMVDFLDHFDGNMEKIGRTLIQEIPPQTKETTCIEWTAQPAGQHGIVVKVDPENLIPEFNEDNNVADRGIQVLPRDTQLPDLTIPGDIWFSNNHPKEGQVINICVAVKNIGQGEANNIEVLFVDIFDGQWNRIGTTIISHLGPVQTAETCHEWKAQPAGQHGIVVKVDPENKIQESNEDNNIVDASITVEPQEQRNLFLTLVRFDNDGNRHLDDVVILVYDRENNAIVGAEVYIDGDFYGRTPDTGTLFAYNFSQGWHVVKVSFNGVTVMKEFYSQG